jgi:hypothetical protein
MPSFLRILPLLLQSRVCIVDKNVFPRTSTSLTGSEFSNNIIFYYCSSSLKSSRYGITPIGAIATGLQSEDFAIRCGSLDNPDEGQQLLEDTDVLLWWGHIAHEEVTDAFVDRFSNTTPWLEPDSGNWVSDDLGTIRKGRYK